MSGVREARKLSGTPCRRTISLFSIGEIQREHLAGGTAVARSRGSVGERIDAELVETAATRLIGADIDFRAVEPGEGESSEILGVAASQVAEYVQGHLLTELHPFPGVGAPVDACCIAGLRDVGGQFVQFATDGQRLAGPWFQR